MLVDLVPLVLEGLELGAPLLRDPRRAGAGATLWDMGAGPEDVGIVQAHGWGAAHPEGGRELNGVDGGQVCVRLYASCLGGGAPPN